MVTHECWLKPTLDEGGQFVPECLARDNRIPYVITAYY